MEFIKAEEFLGQPVEVQKALLDWWKDKKEDTDLVQIELYHGPEIKTYERIKSCNLMLGLEFYPLYTEGQLREYIQYKTGCIINISYKQKPKDGQMELEFDFYEYPTKEKYMIYISTKDIVASSILEAYWKVALEVSRSDIHEM